jgi:hypothetical protein
MNTKKDYERAASIVQKMSEGLATEDIGPLLPILPFDESLRNKCKGAVVWTVREAFVVFFSGDNPRFDVDRFRAACLSSSRPLPFVKPPEPKPCEECADRKYKIVRHYADSNRRSRTIKKGLTLVAAQAHCRDPKTRKHGVWFDAYTDQ